MTQRLRIPDAQTALRYYAAIGGLGVLAVLNGTTALTDALGCILLLTASWSRALSQVTDSSFLRKGLMWFPGAHFLVLTFVSADREDIWGRLPCTVDQAIQFATLVIGVVLLTWLGRLP